MKRFAIAALALVAFSLPIAAQGPLEYGVNVVTDKSADFTKLKTYVWQSGWDAGDRKVHTQIVGAVDRELKALGMTLKTSGPSDVVVKYAALRQIDVEVVSNLGDENAARRQFDVGSLLLLMLEPGTGKELFRARLNKPIEVDPAKVDATVSSAVAEIFAKYPTKKK